MVSVILTILLCVLCYVLGALIGWAKTVKMQKAVVAWKRKALAKTPETPAK